MANNMRWRYGDTRPVLCKPYADTLYEIGDLVSYDISNPADIKIRPASGFPDVATAAATFIGVAMQASAVGKTEKLRIATSGTFSYNVADNPQSSIVVQAVTFDNIAGVPKSQEVELHPIGTTTNMIGVTAEELEPGSNPEVLVLILPGT